MNIQQSEQLMELFMQDANDGKDEEIEKYISDDIRIGTPLSNTFQNRKEGYRNIIKTLNNGYEGGRYISKQEDADVFHIVGIVNVHGVSYNLDALWKQEETDWKLHLLNIQTNL